MKKRVAGFIFLFLIMGLVSAQSLDNEQSFFGKVFDFFKERFGVQGNVELGPQLVPTEFQFSAVDLEKIENAKAQIMESNGHDYSQLYTLIEEKEGSLGQIFALCEEFNPIYCLKKASEENPDLREQICEKLVLRLNEEFVQKGYRINVEGHERECLLGIPQMVY